MLEKLDRGDVGAPTFRPSKYFRRDALSDAELAPLGLKWTGKGLTAVLEATEALEELTEPCRACNQEGGQSYPTGLGKNTEDRACGICHGLLLVPRTES